jgi:hypothetical protein
MADTYDVGRRSYTGPRPAHGLRITTVFKTCPACRKECSVDMLTDHYDRWTDGELLQNAAPEMSPENRETLITGYCAPCQEAIFRPTEEY